MSRTIRNTLYILAYLALAYHFVNKVFLPTFLPNDQDIVNDFGSYYAASRFIAEGINPYRSTDGHQTIQITIDEQTAWQMHKSIIPAYIYPSFLAIIITPLSTLSFPPARILWSVICLVAFVGCIVLTFVIFKRKPQLDVLTLLIITIFVASMPTLETMTLGQVNYIVLLLLMLSWISSTRNSSLLGGALLAAATLIKVSPVLLLLYFIWRKNLRYIIGFVLAFSFFLAMMQLLAPSVDSTYVREVLPAISARAPELNNKAIAVWWQFLFINNALANPIAHLPWLSKALPALTSIVIIILTAIVFQRSRARNAMHEQNNNGLPVFQFAVCLIGLLLIQPYVEIHHLVIAFPALAGIIIYVGSVKFRWQYAVLVGVMLFMLNSRGENSFRWMGPHWYSAFFSNPQGYGLLILYATLLYVLSGRNAQHKNQHLAS